MYMKGGRTMDEINERIKTVVSDSGLTKTAFAERLNITQAYVSALCLGKKTPSDRTIIDICREFDVNETWLRTGAGKMFVQPSSFSLDRFAKEHGCTELEFEIMKAYFELDSEVRLTLVNHFKERLASVKEQATSHDVANSAPPAVQILAPAHTPTIEEEARAEAEQHTQQIYEQILAEKKTQAAVLSGSSVPKAGDGMEKQA